MALPADTGEVSQESREQNGDGRPAPAILLQPERSPSTVRAALYSQYEISEPALIAYLALLASARSHLIQQAPVAAVDEQAGYTDA